MRAGTYNEAVVFPLSGSPVAGSITLQGEPGAILDGTGRSGAGITISNRNYIRVVGLTVRNFRSGTPMGISVEGSSSFIELRNNLIHNIERPNGNAHGIAFYGTAATPMTNIVVEGNEIRNCQLGQSESLVLNGNIDGFSVAGNTVHDNDNIGIDFIGFEGTGPAAQDQARNGVCVDNLVYNITSATNPTYGGDRSAGGIYVDGGRDIVIERNTVDNCDIGIEVASEHSGKAASNITVRNNFIARGYLGNILMGGYAADRGMAQNVVVVNNTTYQGALGEIELQYNCDRITIKNNILTPGPASHTSRIAVATTPMSSWSATSTSARATPRREPSRTPVRGSSTRSSSARSRICTCRRVRPRSTRESTWATTPTASPSRALRISMEGRASGGAPSTSAPTSTPASPQCWPCVGGRNGRPTGSVWCGR